MPDQANSPAMALTAIHHMNSHTHPGVDPAQHYMRAEGLMTIPKYGSHGLQVALRFHAYSEAQQAWLPVKSAVPEYADANGNLIVPTPAVFPNGHPGERGWHLDIPYQWLDLPKAQNNTVAYRLLAEPMLFVNQQLVFWGDPKTFSLQW